MIKKWSEYITESFRKLSHTEDDIYKYTLDLLEDRINDLFVDVHQEFDTESGDITPDQSFKLSDLKEKIARLVSQQVHQNLGRDFKKIKSSEIDIDELKELSDERDSVKEGDEVITVYFDGGFSIYKFTTQLDKYNNELGYRDPRSHFKLKDAYLVVKVDTYNDFVSPEKRI